MSGQLVTSAWLAWRDWKHEIFLSLCGVLAMVSMLSPILILVGLRNGVIDGMRRHLLENPRVLIITPKSDGGKFTREFVSGLARLPGANYAVVRTRDITSDVTFINPAVELKTTVNLEPATPGEPVLKKLGIPVPSDGSVPEIVLSTNAAKSLHVKQGDEIILNLGRRTPKGRLETKPVNFRVSAVLPPEEGDGRVGFVALSIMEAIEDYHDYIEVPERGFSGEPRQEERRFASFRLYARDLDAVESLVEHLKENRIETTAPIADIASIRELEAAINITIFILSCVIGAGFIGFTISSVQGAVLRKRKQLALLRLFGLKRPELVEFPLVQIFLTLVSGFLLSLCVYLGVSHLIPYAYKEHGNLDCILTLPNVATIAVVVFVLSVACCLVGAWKSASIEPSTVIRGE